MNQILISLVFFASIIGFGQNQIDFGIEVQMNQNLIKKWDLGTYNEDDKALSVLDITGDTLDIYLTKFSMENNFEIPVYFRYSWKNRQFLDFKMSNSFNTITMEGVSNYNSSFYEANYGTYTEFETQAIADGFTSVDTSDYDNYISTAKNDWESKIKSTEKFQLLSLTMNYGFKFFPHKSVKMFSALGFTIKGRYRKTDYTYLDFSNDFVQDLSKLDDGVYKFSDGSAYVNFVLGFELYRFRLSLFYQTGQSYGFSNTLMNEQVVFANAFTPFQRVHSFGFSLGVDLFSKKLGNKVETDDVSKEDLTISNMKRKLDKWDIGMRFNRRGFNEVSSFYQDSKDQLSILSRDSVLINYNGKIMNAENIEMLTFGDVKKIAWSPQVDLFGNYYFSKRFSVEGSIGFSILTIDFETTELKATVLNDSLGSFYLQSTGNPRLRSTAFRKGYVLTNLTASVAYKLVDRDLFDFKILAGVGITGMGHIFQAAIQQPEGVNELDIYNATENAYFYLSEEDPEEIYAYQGEMNVDLNESPDQVLSKFPDEYMVNTWSPKKTIRKAYPTLKWGFEASIERFTLGLFFENSLNYMDGFMLNQYGTALFSIGYKIWVR